MLRSFYRHAATITIQRNYAVRTYLSLTPVAVGVRISLIGAVYQTLPFRWESGYAKVPSVHHALETITVVYKQLHLVVEFQELIFYMTVIAYTAKQLTLGLAETSMALFSLFSLHLAILIQIWSDPSFVPRLLDRRCGLEQAKQRFHPAWRGRNQRA